MRIDGVMPQPSAAALPGAQAGAAEWTDEYIQAFFSHRTLTPAEIAAIRKLVLVALPSRLARAAATGLEDAEDERRKLLNGLPSLSANLRSEGQTSRADVVDLAHRHLAALTSEVARLKAQYVDAGRHISLQVARAERAEAEIAALAAVTTVTQPTAAAVEGGR